MCRLDVIHDRETSFSVGKQRIIIDRITELKIRTFIFLNDEGHYSEQLYRKHKILL